MRSLQGRQCRSNNLRLRIGSDANDHLKKCSIFGCSQFTQRATKTGLSVTLCRKHLLHRQRHGSAWCASPTAKTLAPYLKASLTYIDLHRGDPFIVAALAGLERLMAFAGPVILATRLRGLPPAQRARVALARLREAEVPPQRLLAIVMAIHALIEEGPQVVHRISEWRIVAIAKAAHRLASGHHRVWETTDTNGRVYRTELHAWPRSSGRVLRHLGELIEAEFGLVIEERLAAVLTLKIARYGPHPAIADPFAFAPAANNPVSR